MKSKKAAVLMILAAFVGLVVIQSVPAAPAKTKPNVAACPKSSVRDTKFKGMPEYLNLTDDQKAAAKKIFATAKEKARAVKADTSLTPEKKKAQLMEIRKAAIAKFRALLDPNQQKKLDQLREARRHRFGDRSMPVAKLQRIKTALNLTPEQETAVDRILAAYRDQFKALFGDDKLTREQKKARFMELRQAMLSEIRQLLTPEQQKKFDQIMERVRTRHQKSEKAPAVR